MAKLSIITASTASLTLLASVALADLPGAFQGASCAMSSGHTQGALAFAMVTIGAVALAMGRRRR